MSEKCEHLNEDGTFKGGFDGCVLHMQSDCGGNHSEESAKKICGSIAQQVGASSMRPAHAKKFMLEAALADEGISLETLRQNVCSSAADLPMFKTDADKPYQPWVRDIVAPPHEDGETWCAILGGPDGKIYEVNFTVSGDGKASVTGDPKEVIQEVVYTEAAQPRKDNGTYHGPAAATKEAYSASANAQTKEHHTAAAELHDKAADMHKKDGNAAMASLHSQKAKFHRDQAQAMPESTPVTASAGVTAKEVFLLEGGFAFEAPTSATFNKFMVMAGGVHTVTLGCMGHPLQVTINVTPESAKALQKQLNAVNSSGKQKAFNCFDHEKKAASSWPIKYFWSDSPAPGVYEAAEPSQAGLEAVEGKTYRGFSMTFFTDAEITPKRGGCEIKAGAKGSPENPANIICPLEAGDDPSPYLNMGTMTNRPAFTENEPLFASQPGNPPGAPAQSHTPPTAAARTAGAQTQPSNTTTMKTTQLDAAALQERCGQLEARVAELQAKTDAVSQAQLNAAQAELEAVQAKLELAKEKEKSAGLEAAQIKQKEKEADAAVETMVGNGVIPTMNKEMRAEYRAKFIADPSLIPLCTAMRGVINPGRHATNGTALTASAQFGYGDLREGAMRILKAVAACCQRQAGIPGLDASACQQRSVVAREIATIYHNEIRGKVMELDAQGNPRPSMNPDYIMAPLEAATDAQSLGTLAGTLVAQRFLDIFMYKLPLITNGKIMTDFSDMPSDLNQTVSTRKIIIPAPVTYDPTLQADGFPNGWIPTGAPQTADINITMNTLVGTPIQFDLAVLSSTQRQLFAEQAPAAAYANALYLMKTIYNVCTAGNFNAYAAVTAADANGIVKVPTAYVTYPVALIDFARSKLADIAAAFDANEVPDEDRSVLLNAAYYNKATTDPSLVTFFAGQQAPEIVTQGKLPDLAGFVPIKAPNFPAAGNGVGIALQKNGLLVKTRLPANLNTIQPGAGNGTVTQIVHPDTGVSMMVVLWTDHRRGYSAWLPCFILGASAGDTRGGLVITSQ